jgi:hypothetical protein
VLLTNSLATNNHTPVHSHYSSYRKDLLRAGVELWEARADAAKITTPDGQTELDQLTLHTKGILIDGKRIFVGSVDIYFAPEKPEGVAQRSWIQTVAGKGFVPFYRFYGPLEDYKAPKASG